MTTLEIITPSYAPDRELCGDLVQSVTRLAPPDTRHTVIVPARDVTAFAPLRAGGADVQSTRTIMPRSFRALPGVNAWLNVRTPWVPVRGWIAQQIIKLEAVARSAADAVLVVDSDVIFIRPFTADDFLVDARVPLYALPDAVSAELPRHMMWDAVARRLLGLPGSDATTHPDYICWPCLWDPELVRGALKRVADVTGKPWASAIGAELHFSEMVLYGVYAQEIAGVATRTADMHCPSFSDERALDAAALDGFLSRVRPTDVAVMISAKSGTDLGERRRALRRIAAHP
jgi:hypothetical protein